MPWPRESEPLTRSARNSLSNFWPLAADRHAKLTAASGGRKIILAPQCSCRCCASRSVNEDATTEDIARYLFMAMSEIIPAAAFSLGTWRPLFPVERSPMMEFRRCRWR
ncbi:hypothetical protein MESS4_20046 [Mesorhizobium sp. STM 4661]|nr:hypothetical protein MESS4_20046 [Mesorhizobium sp. STM 4661]